MIKMGRRPVALPWENVTFEPSPDGSLRVRNSAQLGPYPPRLTERLRHWRQSRLIACFLPGLAEGDLMSKP